MRKPVISIVIRKEDVECMIGRKLTEAQWQAVVERFEDLDSENDYTVSVVDIIREIAENVVFGGVAK